MQLSDRSGVYMYASTKSFLWSVFLAQMIVVSAAQQGSSFLLPDGKVIEVSPAFVAASGLLKKMKEDCGHKVELKEISLDHEYATPAVINACEGLLLQDRKEFQLSSFCGELNEHYFLGTMALFIDHVELDVPDFYKAVIQVMLEEQEAVTEIEKLFKESLYKKEVVNSRYEPVRQKLIDSLFSLLFDNEGVLMTGSKDRNVKFWKKGKAYFSELTEESPYFYSLRDVISFCQTGLLPFYTATV